MTFVERENYMTLFFADNQVPDEGIKPEAVKQAVIMIKVRQPSTCLFFSIYFNKNVVDSTV